jgi:hypothetical protein
VPQLSGTPRRMTEPSDEPESLRRVAAGSPPRRCAFLPGSRLRGVLVSDIGRSRRLGALLEMQARHVVLGMFKFDHERNKSYASIASLRCTRYR